MPARTLSRTPPPGLLLPLLTALLWLASTPPRASAQEEGVGGLSALELPLGARPIGMGRAFVASTGDLQGLLYNPAGLAGRDSAGVTFSRYQADSELDINGNYAAVSFPVIAGAATLAFNYEDLGEIQLTGSSPDPLGTEDLRNLLAVGSYAVELTPAVSLGGSVKYLSSDLGAGDGTGFAFDAGALLRPVASAPGLTLGAAVLNVGPDIQFEIDEGLGDDTGDEGEGDPLPSRFRWGGAFEVRGGEDAAGDAVSPYGLKLAADVEHNIREIGQASLFGGVAVDYRQLVILRGGVLRLDNAFGEESVSGAAIGAGVHWRNLRIDLAREIGVNEIGDEMHFSLGADF